MPKSSFYDFAVVGDSTLGEKLTLAWKVLHFDDLPHKSGEKLKNIKALSCHGHSWSLLLYPRGCDKLISEGGNYVSIFLVLKSEGDITVNYTVRVEDYTMTGSREGTRFTQNSKSGWKYFCRRDDLLAKLAYDGNVLIEVDIQVHTSQTQPLIPRNTLPRDMLGLLRSGTGSDVCFLVEGKKFLVHSGILATRAPTLAELADSAAPGTEIPLEGIDGIILNALLRNIYAGVHPSNELMAHKARDILDAADRFGCTNLKLLAESKLVEDGVTTKTAAELLCFADAKSCALLKEAALNHLKTNAEAVMKSPGWGNIEESPILINEVIKALVPKSSNTKVDDDFDNMTVVDLRLQLQEEDLEEDGTREMLVQRLRDHNSTKAKHSGEKRMIGELN